MDDERTARLEWQVEDLGRRVALLERQASAGRTAAPHTPRRPSPRAAAIRPAPAAARPAPAPAPDPLVRLRERLGLAPDDGLEDLLGGRVLAWVGGVAILLGLAFLFAVAISNGWIGEEARTGLAALGSTAMLALGIWLHEHKGRTDAALAAVSTGVAGMFLTITVATQVYELLPSLLGTVFAVVVGGIATALAVRWESRGIGALGILGALAAPLLAGADYDGGTVTILFVALAAAAGVLVWQRWDWLALAAFALSAPQWIVYLFDGASPASAIAVLIGFGALGVALAVGHDLRVSADRLRLAPAFLLALNAIVVATAGWGALEWMGHPGTGQAWLGAVAVVHVAVGIAGLRVARISRDLALLSLVLGIIGADVLFALVADGAVLVVGWAVTGVGFAALLRRVPVGGRDDLLAGAGLGGHVTLALVTTLTVDDPVAVLGGEGTLSAACAASVAALAAGSLVSARLAEEQRPEWRLLLDGVGLAAVAVLSALALDGEALVLAWIAEVAALTALARRLDDPVAGWAALGFLALAGGHALAYEAPPMSLVTGLAQPAAAVIALGATAAAALLVREPLSGLHVQMRPALTASAALALLYLASGLVVTPFESGGAVDSELLSAHQQGQMVLSVFWALVGVGTLLVGLRRDLHALRVAALGLLGVAVVKVFLFDLATLTSLYRVVSFIGLGLLLLLGAYVWQRLRPRPLPDLRETAR
jgi:uncharacterized membrane protein